MKRLYLFSIVILGIISLQSCSTNKHLASTSKSELLKPYQDYSGHKNDVYDAANSWMKNSFDYSNPILHFNDREKGVITGKYIFIPINDAQTPEEGIYVMIEIKVKDKSTKITIKPELYQKNASVFEDGIYPTEKIDAKIDLLIGDLKSVIKRSHEDAFEL